MNHSDKDEEHFSKPDLPSPEKSAQSDEEGDPVEEQILDELVSRLAKDVLKTEDRKSTDKFSVMTVNKEERTQARPTEQELNKAKRREASYIIKSLQKDEIPPVKPHNHPGLREQEPPHQPKQSQEIITQKIEELQRSLQEVTKFSDQMEKMDAVLKTPQSTMNKIFIVRGSDDSMLNAVVQALQKLSFKTVISHDRAQPDKTIVQKFTDNPNIGFAVVVLSEDEIGYRKDQESSTARSRAKQSVVFELGFLLGQLGRNRVFVLYHEEKNFELPTNYFEVIYTSYDHLGHWQFELARRLKNCDFKVDANKLL